MKTATPKAKQVRKGFVPMTHETANYEALLMHGTLSDVIALAIALTDNR